MTKKGLRKCRAVDGEENQRQVFQRRPRALGNRWRDSHIPAAPDATAVGKWKSKPGFPLSHRSFLPLKVKPERRTHPQPVTLVFRLISGLENAGGPPDRGRRPRRPFREPDRGVRRGRGRPPHFKTTSGRLLDAPPALPADRPPLSCGAWFHDRIRRGAG